MSRVSKTPEMSQSREETEPGPFGEFVDLRGERYYVIRDVDRLSPFLVNLVSSDDHWLFVSSTGGMTAGRVSRDQALFPYVTVDKLHEAAHSTGGISLLRIRGNENAGPWQPFGPMTGAGEGIERNLYKNTLANKLCFEEINQELQLAWRCTWMTSERYGFVRHFEIENRSGQAVALDVVDGIQNLLPAGVLPEVQSVSSNLVNAYRWNELDRETGLATFSLYAGITDRAMPSEALRANTVFCLDLEDHQVLLSSKQLAAFRRGGAIEGEAHQRGNRGAYLVGTRLHLTPDQRRSWRIVADVDYSQAEVVALRQRLRDPRSVATELDASVASGTGQLARTMGAADAFQHTAHEMESAHHYANVLFNVLRGGVFADQYRVSRSDFSASVAHFNHAAHRRNRDFIAALPERIRVDKLNEAVREHGDPDVERLARDYLPITFGRRHGDPSRPWNQFNIRLRDRQGGRLLSYEGNWRDIFQNWEALLFSYPAFLDNVISKFLNASTPDGHNPYRISKEGIDWEVEDADDPWSYIGYWGDHQIIYLTKLLEWSLRFEPERLPDLLRRRSFSYANVPYRIRPFEALLEDPKHTVDFDADLAGVIDRRVHDLGADGKLVLDAQGAVVRVNLAEKLLVPVLAKLCNLVIDGGIWMNTQRPEWNDANNALVGNGLSVVTLCYLHRHLTVLCELLRKVTEPVELSNEVAGWVVEVAATLRSVRSRLEDGPADGKLRLEALRSLGEAAERYRANVYGDKAFADTRSLAAGDLRTFLADAREIVRSSIEANRRDDGLFHAYNLLRKSDGRIAVDRLYPMLEGQVAALSSGCIETRHVGDVIEALFASAMYRPDQKSFMLYPDRNLPGFLEKNRIAAAEVTAIPLLATLAERGDERLVVRDADGQYRFHPDLTNSEALERRLEQIDASGTAREAKDPAAVRALYEKVFRHREFTGRSGTMFGFEGLGCIYWHMVAKLLLAVQENFFEAIGNDGPRAEWEHIGRLYYRIRGGLGFNKSPADYGAFPADPYSHTPGHAGARQPGMTGQVKEEVLTRFGELGVKVHDGTASFHPALLRRREFTNGPASFAYLDVTGTWQELTVPESGLAFTWCQVPVIYRLQAGEEPRLRATLEDGSVRLIEGSSLPAAESEALFLRTGRIRRLDLVFDPEWLFPDHDGF